MATEAEIQKRISQLANEFQSLQQQVQIAGTNCATNKAAALAAFDAAIRGFNNLLNSVVSARATAQSSGLTNASSSLQALSVNVTQALSNAARAKQACQNSTPVVKPQTDPAVNQLQEVKVTGTRNPAELQEVQVTGVRNPAGLQEVQVTGKRNPDELQEVQVTGVRNTSQLEEVKVTGKRNPDELQEVQVTGKRNPDELQEVTVTGKKNTNTGVAPQIRKAQAQASLQDATNFGEAKDWRVRLALAPGANYLYKAADPGILKPLSNSQGVIFPYTPTINVNYNANYQQTSVVHSNYKILQYENSSVDSITISCDFTAQDTEEANYVLAVIHFFRAATKMFYGQDENPKPGTPPPLVFLFGMGQFQFNAHPLVITNFSYNLPADVDYIRAGVAGAASGPNAALAQSPQKSLTLGSIIQNKIQNKISSGIAKIGSRIGLNLTVGGGLGAPTFGASFNPLNPVAVSDPTYVPTKINLSISCMPIISRNNVSNNFSFKDYANGKLLQGVRNPSGGFW